MPIADLTVVEFQDRVNRFAVRYVDDWNCWLHTQANARPRQLGVILRRWQACRPNSMRRTRIEKAHKAPYLEDLVKRAEPHIKTLQNFDIRKEASFSDKNCAALRALWKIFQNLSYQGRARNGLAGVVGISKTVLLLSDGRVGPAFDATVRRDLGIGNVTDSDQWVKALKMANKDIQAFERNNKTTIQEATPPEYAHLNTGRIYDMALGPRE